jgi:DNA-binding NarL/FixJ family response regulator
MRKKTRDANRVRVVLVDDNPLYIEMLELLLEADARIEVVDRAFDGATGVERALALRPDVVVMDVQMPQLDGIEATRRIRCRLGSTRVVVVTSSEVPTHRKRARLAGAASFLRKDAPLEELLAAIAGPLPAHASTFHSTLLVA